jgi:hypothetical protein
VLARRRAVNLALSCNIELDVVDAGELGVLSLSRKGALDKINYQAWKLTNPNDFDPAVRRDDMIANIYFSSVLRQTAARRSGAPRR